MGPNPDSRVDLVKMTVSKCMGKEHRAISWESDFFCGIHSNLPLCCVLFYCDVWREKLESEIEIRGKKPIGYIMCPDCVAKLVGNKTKPAQIKNCNCWCYECDCLSDNTNEPKYGKGCEITP